MNTYTWSNGPNTSVNNVLPLTNTVYIVNGTNSLTGCISSNSISIVVMDCTGLSTNDPTITKIAIYPNPSKDKINIKAEINSEINYTLSDLLGRNLLEGEFKNTTTLNLSDFNNGTYIIKLSIGKNIIYKKVIINK